MNILFSQSCSREKYPDLAKPRSGYFRYYFRKDVNCSQCVYPLFIKITIKCFSARLSQHSSHAVDAGWIADIQLPIVFFHAVRTFSKYLSGGA